MSTSDTAKQRNSGPDTRVAEMEAFFERAQLAQAPAWRPEKDDILSGAILGFRLGSTVEFGEYPVLVVSSDSGPVAFHCFHHLVRERLRELQPKKGDVITVMYGGKKDVTPEEEKAGKKAYHVYYIESGAVEATPVLDTMTF